MIDIEEVEVMVIMIRIVITQLYVAFTYLVISVVKTKNMKFLISLDQVKLEHLSKLMELTMIVKSIQGILIEFNPANSDLADDYEDQEVRVFQLLVYGQEGELVEEIGNEGVDGCE
ncbi:MAG: hypothetical protein EZS28_006541 [Streblomastix strix]|uniref:Uncharacterized protein n=1 Tax=Streblomastix strix TaxID=222440 RepID=A0A5J4WTM8_9EUKA|nr:MAG: hypothetical protein EZS28_006541 [Streblomastix strix]